MLVILLATGCGAPSYATAREACAVPEGEFRALPTAPLSAECAATLGRIVGLQWDAFGEAPHEVPVEPRTTTDRVIGGLYTLVAADVGDAADLDHAIFTDELLGQGYPEGLVGGSANSLDAASLFWTKYLSERVTNVEPDPDDGCYFRYEGEGRATICFDAADLDIAAGSPPAIAAGLIHEAGHAHGPPHATDGEFEWDVGIGGEYGIQARFLEGWLQRNASVDNNTCAAVAWQLSQVCARIQPNYGFSPCAVVDWCSHTGE